MNFMSKLLLKRILPTVVGAIIVVLAGLWLYGYVGVKAGWIGPTKVPNLNSISHSGAEAAGGITTATKVKLGLSRRLSNFFLNALPRRGREAAGDARCAFDALAVATLKQASCVASLAARPMAAPVRFGRPLCGMGNF